MSEPERTPIDQDTTGITEAVDFLLQELVGQPLESLTISSICQSPLYKSGLLSFRERVDGVEELASMQLTPEEARKGLDMLNGRVQQIMDFTETIEGRIDSEAEETRIRCRFIMENISYIQRILFALT